MVEKPSANAGDKRCGFDPWTGKIPLEEGMATQSRVLAWGTPGTQGLDARQCTGSPRVRHD